MRVVLAAVTGRVGMGQGRGMGGEGGGESVNGRIFWSNTPHHLATSSEASTSGCHGSAEND